MARNVPLHGVDDRSVHKMEILVSRPTHHLPVGREIDRLQLSHQYLSDIYTAKNITKISSFSTMNNRQKIIIDKATNIKKLEE